MNDQEIRGALAGQFEAALAMLTDCIRACPEAMWDGAIAKYPFWHVAYHTLCFVECYLSPSNEAFTATVEDRVARNKKGEDSPGFQPMGMKELEDEYPSRRFSRDELLLYAAFGAAMVRRVLREGDDEPLAGPSGFAWLPFTRLELHIYNLRHVQHHAGALGAALRRHGVGTSWVRTG